MGFDLGDAWDRATNQGKYSKFRHKGSMIDNMSPWGKTEREFSLGVVNPFGKDHEKTAKLFDKGDTMYAINQYHADNPIGEPIKKDMLNKGYNDREASEKAHTGVGQGIGTAIATIYGGGWFKGLSSAGKSASAAKGVGTASKGTSFLSKAKKVYSGAKKVKGVSDALSKKPAQKSTLGTKSKTKLKEIYKNYLMNKTEEPQQQEKEYIPNAIREYNAGALDKFKAGRY